MRPDSVSAARMPWPSFRRLCIGILIPAAHTGEGQVRRRNSVAGVLGRDLAKGAGREGGQSLRLGVRILSYIKFWVCCCAASSFGSGIGGMKNGSFQGLWCVVIRKGCSDAGIVPSGEDRLPHVSGNRERV